MRSAIVWALILVGCGGGDSDAPGFQPANDCTTRRAALSMMLPPGGSAGAVAVCDDPQSQAATGSCDAGTGTVFGSGRDTWPVNGTPHNAWRCAVRNDTAVDVYLAVTVEVQCGVCTK